VEIVSYRVRVRVAVPKYQAREEPAKPGALEVAVKGRRAVHFDASAPVEATLYERDRLPVPAHIAGPAIVEQFDATTVIPPGWSGATDRFGNLVLTRA
jgi:N-methylhydantoinase A